MKAKIHPQYFPDLKITCACGNTILAGSTKKELKTEICSACHPFYTGQQKLIDTTGRVDKFLAKVKKAQKLKEKKVKIVDKELDDIIHDAEATEAEEAKTGAEPVQTGFLTEEASPEIKKAVKAKAAKKAAKKPAVKKVK